MNSEKQLVDFNATKDRYREVIDRSIQFAGKSLDYYTKVKADTLKRAVASHFPNLHHPKLLDVGCGHGLIHPYLADRFDITGTDIAEEVLAIAARENAGVSYVPYDGAKLPFANACFDLALAICVMHHVPPSDWITFLGEMKRVVRPGGGIFIFEHNPFNPFTRYIVAHNELDHGVTLLSGGHLRKLMRASGLRAPATEHILFTPLSQRCFTYLDVVLKWCPLGAQYFTFART